MREILFRAKRVDNGQWLESGSFCRCGDDGINWDYYLGTGKPAIHEIDPHGNIRASTTLDDCMFCMVDSNTIGQYTGLTDKNGKKIFEGDIVKATIRRDEGYIESIRNEKGVIAFDSLGMIGLMIDRTGDNIPVWSDFFCELSLSGNILDYCFEVIGNIHDNPEFLGGNS